MRGPPNGVPPAGGVGLTPGKSRSKATDEYQLSARMVCLLLVVAEPCSCSVLNEGMLAIPLHLQLLSPEQQPADRCLLFDLATTRPEALDLPDVDLATAVRQQGRNLGVVDSWWFPSTNFMELATQSEAA